MGRMGKLGAIEFDYMDMDVVLCHVKRDKDGNYEVQNFSRNPWELVFKGGEPSDEKLLKFFERRSFRRERPDVAIALEEIGLTEYDPRLIVRKTHGSFFHDTYWIRFKGEDLDFNGMRTLNMGPDWQKCYKQD